MSSIQGGAAALPAIRTVRWPLSGRAVNIVLLAMLAAVLVAYLSLLNSLTESGFVLSDLKNREQTLVSANNELQAKADWLNSYSYLDAKIKASSLVITAGVTYWPPVGPQLASR